jgi:hypothetical protein
MMMRLQKFPKLLPSEVKIVRRDQIAAVQVPVKRFRWRSNLFISKSVSSMNINVVNTSGVNHNTHLNSSKEHMRSGDSETFCHFNIFYIRYVNLT